MKEKEENDINKQQRRERGKEIKGKKERERESAIAKSKRKKINQINSRRKTDMGDKRSLKKMK